MSDARTAASPIRIQDHTIGSAHSCFVIAEAGVNHNGDPELALALVEAAARAGADCVKFQTFAADRVASVGAEKAPYQRATTRSGGSQLDMLRALELPVAAYPRLIDACARLGLVFLSTPYSVEDAELLESVGVSAFKVASAQIVEHAFLRRLAAFCKPILLSTGMATLDEVDAAMRVLRSAGNEQIVLLQCTTNYPSRIAEANLRVLPTLARSFGTHVGYSDHTENAVCCIASIALGAVVIEKHLTLDKAMSGPDHEASADPAEFRQLVAFIRQVEAALGTGLKEPCAAEMANRDFMRRSIVARTDIPAGATLTPEMVTFKRPGGGISPVRLDDVIGRRSRVPFSRDELIRWDDLQP